VTTASSPEDPRFVLVDGLGGQWLAVETNEHNCAGGTMESGGAHEAHCGLEPIALVTEVMDRAYGRRLSVIEQQQSRPVPPPHPLTMAGRRPPSQQTCPGGWEYLD
jgi:hypothetical protein